MKTFVKLLLIFGAGYASLSMAPLNQQDEAPKWALAIHGGAGWITKGRYSDSMEQVYLRALDTALMKGQDILEAGGSAEEAVIACIVYMEDCPLFNAGRGAVTTASGTRELDASIMRGHDLQAGAVAGVMRVKNPIKAASAVMNKSKHVLLSREGAEQFAKEQGIEMVDPSWFEPKAPVKPSSKDKKHGTVGAVALDQKGHLAAGTSTGGMQDKQYGRIGDSPMIGAGTYANGFCAVSCTGHGEHFIRNYAAARVSALMEYGGLNLQQASDSVIHGILMPKDGRGGLISMNKQGQIHFSFNTPGMFRGSVSDGKNRESAMYGTEYGK